MRALLIVAALALCSAPLAAQETEKSVGTLLIECAPTEYETAIDCLETHLTPESLTTLKEEGAVMAHFGLGMWIRNNWGLWGGGPLGQSLNKMGFVHPDDMSSEILAGLVARLRGEEYDLEARIAYYRSYWDAAAEEEPPEPLVPTPQEQTQTETEAPTGERDSENH